MQQASPQDEMTMLFTGALKQLRLALVQAEMAEGNVGTGHQYNLLLHFRQAVAAFQHEYDRRHSLHDDFIDNDDDIVGEESDHDDSVDSNSEGSWNEDDIDDVVDELNDACPVGLICRAEPDAAGDGTCSICRAGYAPHHIVWHLPCQHVFHRFCLNQWWRHASQHNCPMCKRDYDA